LSDPKSNKNRSRLSRSPTPRKRRIKPLISESWTFLKKLIETPGPSGYEREVAAVWRSYAESFADEVDRDLTGNSYAWLRTNPELPTILVEGHIDEIGVQITHIDPEGYIWFDEIGGWDAQVLTGQRIKFATASGPVIGVVGRKAAHLLDESDRDKAVKLRDLWIDIGAGSRDEALKQVSIGDAGVVDAPFTAIGDGLIVSRAMDNRTGAYVALETLRLLVDDRPLVNVVAVAAAQEEVSYGGAFTAAFKIDPMVAIAIDVTHATDYPGADKRRNDEVALGSGPVLKRGASINPIVYERLVAAAAAAKIPYTVKGSPKASGTDADAMIKSGRGPATAVVSIPTRYMHSPNETIAVKDLDACALLLAEFVRQIEQTTDFRP
jgi:putative aminopeptidase FrvX